MTGKETMKFTVPSDDKENMRRILRNVYEALTEKGYNPINQIVGYLPPEPFLPTATALNSCSPSVRPSKVAM